MLICGSLWVSECKPSEHMYLRNHFYDCLFASVRQDFQLFNEGNDAMISEAAVLSLF